MIENYYRLNSRSTLARLLLVAIILFAISFAWLSVKWQIGILLADLTQPSRPDANQVSKYAIALAPLNPQAWWLSAATEIDLYTPEKIADSIKMFEESVRLSPKDYRLWTELGRAYEQAGDPTKAEVAFRQAIRLAPTYAFPHWQLGNFLIREGRPDEAIAELRKTTEYDTTYRDQAYSLIWNYSDNDTARVEELAADSVDAKVGLAQFFAWRVRPADSLRVWNTLSEQEKNSSRQTAVAIAEAMNEKRTFWEGLEFAVQAGIDPDARVEMITNGGFESPITAPSDTLYSWKITRADSRVDFSSDSAVKHSGSRSLRTVFRSYVNPNFYGIWQNVAASPSAKFRLSFWVRTENLRSAGTPLIEIVNAADDKVIAISKPIPAGTNDWQKVDLDFTTPEVCTGLYVRSSRGYCGDNCPVVGTMWLDDFVLVRL